jgi:hypothetical protein
MLSCAINMSNMQDCGAITANADKAIITIVGHNRPRTQYTDLSVDVTNTKRACGGVVGLSPSTRYLQ